MDSENFPLPNLGAQLRALADELYNGRGFFLIRGLPLCRHSMEDGVIIFLGLQSYIAQKRGCQDDEGNVIGRKTCLMFHNMVNLGVVHIVSDSKTSNLKHRLHARYSTSSIV